MKRRGIGDPVYKALEAIGVGEDRVRHCNNRQIIQLSTWAIRYFAKAIDAPAEDLEAIIAGVDTKKADIAALPKRSCCG